MHNLYVFTVPQTGGGTYYIRILNNDGDSNETGNYSIRILPNHNDLTASWDLNEEPNNAWNNAFNMQVGAANAITTRVEPRGTFTTSSHDVDWYQFTGITSTSYTIEIFDVTVPITAGRGLCDTITTLTGLSIEVFDTDGTTRLGGQCQTVGSGNVH